MADFRAIYHLSPAEASQLPFPEYLALVYRLPAYSGVMAARMAEADASKKDLESGRREAIMADPILSDVISFG